jgi:hypothetical protein
MVSGLYSNYLLFGDISLKRDSVLVDESILKNLCWVFSPTRVSQEKIFIYCGCLSFSDPYACSYFSNSLNLNNMEYTYLLKINFNTNHLK